MFLGYIHYFRALAIFFIVSGHSIDAFLWVNNENIERLLRIYISNGSVLFVFIAGYLFQHLSSKYEIKKYYKSKIHNVIVPYILVSVPAIIVFVFFMEQETVWDGFYQYNAWQQTVLFYLTGKHLAPLWFIPMITLFYVVAPILIKADKNGAIYYALPIFIIISCLINRGLPYRNFVHFFSAYLLGMACSKYKSELNTIISTNYFLYVALAISILLGSLEFLYMNGTMTYLNYLQKIVIAIFFLGLFIKFNEKLNNKFIALIADFSFGIFFIHSYIVSGSKVIYKYFFSELPIGNITYHLFASVIFLLLSTLAVFFVKKLAGKNSRWIIGS